jgi:hypothetical protein
MRRLVGRDQEVDALVGLLDARDQLSGAALLSGEAGIGKTTVWLAGVEAATARGYRVPSSRPSEAETKFSFVGLTDLLDDAADEVLAELPPIQQRALEAALLLGESEIHADDRSVAAAFLGAPELLPRRRRPAWQRPQVGQSRRPISRAGGPSSSGPPARVQWTRRRAS